MKIAALAVRQWRAADMGGTFRPGYIRPGQLWRSFVLETLCQRLDSVGNAVSAYERAAPPLEIRAILTSADAREMAAYQQAGHPVTHVITHRGTPAAKAGDRLIYGKRAFYVQGVDNPGELGVWTLYYCEERKGAHDGHHS